MVSKGRVGYERKTTLALISLGGILGDRRCIIMNGGDRDLGVAVT